MLFRENYPRGNNLINLVDDGTNLYEMSQKILWIEKLEYYKCIAVLK